ncbi:MAG: VOC family protein [Mariprofundaceae bacterium]
MTRTDPRAENMRWLTPYLTVENAEASMAFYDKAFGFDPGNTMPDPDGKIMHAEMAYEGKTIVMFGPEGAWGSACKTPKHSGVDSPISLYVYCEDVDSLVKQALQAGAEVLAEPEDVFWGDRIARLRDANGYTWTFATNVGEFDASKIPPMEA